MTVIKKGLKAMARSASGVKKTLLQQAGSILGFCYLAVLTFFGVALCPIAWLPVLLVGFLLVVLVDQAKNGNPWPALVVVNVLGFVISRAIRQWVENRTARLP